MLVSGRSHRNCLDAIFFPRHLSDGRFDFDPCLTQVGRTASIVTDSFYALAYPKATVAPPILLADMQTTNGSDTDNLRPRNKTLSSVEVKMAEEQSKDSETGHGKEEVGYILLTPKP